MASTEQIEEKKTLAPEYMRICFSVALPLLKDDSIAYKIYQKM